MWIYNNQREILTFHNFMKCLALNLFFHIHCLTQSRTAVVVKPCNQHELSPKMSWKISSYLVAGWTKRLAGQHLKGVPMLDDAQGQETSLAPPYSNLRSFRNKCAVLKKVLMALLGLFGASSDLAPRAFLPPPRYAPAASLTIYFFLTFSHTFSLNYGSLITISLEDVEPLRITFSTTSTLFRYLFSRRSTRASIT